MKKKTQNENSTSMQEMTSSNKLDTGKNKFKMSLQQQQPIPGRKKIYKENKEL